MTIIESGSGVLTQINLFTCRPENQQALIALLRESAAAVSDVDGWISASIHRGLEGDRVVNYAQSRDAAAQAAVMARLRAGGYLACNTALGTAHPGLYEVVATIGR
ncbi:MAG: antibiotic biosynthesis monooxygenase [Pseudomonadota bacterium]|uniref:antibiotic biosynthesis monooxygenase n=1 Tax=Sphingomonas sp. ERG5 TaxID=1381597 RepID=UPI00054B916D|nr:antibiotic biosynthesis monooxygenase [Sphingomonas sp. ERG5]